MLLSFANFLDEGESRPSFLWMWPISSKEYQYSFDFVIIVFAFFTWGKGVHTLFSDSVMDTLPLHKLMGEGVAAFSDGTMQRLMNWKRRL